MTIAFKVLKIFLLLLLLLAVFKLSYFFYQSDREPEKLLLVKICFEASAYSAEQVEERIARPLERLLSTFDNVKHVYSASMRNYAVITVAFSPDVDYEKKEILLNKFLLLNRLELPYDVSEPKFGKFCY